MSILSTTINGTHTNSIQESATFVTRIQSPNSVVVEITIKRDGANVGHSDFVLDSNAPSHDVIISGNSVTLSGKLTLERPLKAVQFSGSLTFPGQVQVGMTPVIVAVF